MFILYKKKVCTHLFVQNNSGRNDLKLGDQTLRKETIFSFVLLDLFKNYIYMLFSEKKKFCESKYHLRKVMIPLQI